MDSILNPTIFIGNFEWREPVTTLTDLLVAIAAIIGFLKFKKYKGHRSAGFNYFKFYFLFFSIGMTSAAWLGHGLQAYVGPSFKIIGWVCGASGLLLFGLGTFKEVKYLMESRVFSALRFLFVAQYLIFVFLMIHPNHSDFIYAQISSTVSLIAFILPLHVYNFRINSSKGSFIIFLTILFGIIPGFVYSNKISLNHWFNYHDISHVLMAIFMSLMIIGTSKLTMKYQ